MTKDKLRRLKSLARDLVQFCIDNKYNDCAIYYNNKRILINYDNKIKVEKNINVNDYIEWGNPEQLTMSFEGELYHLLNYYNARYSPFYNIFKKHGFYYEFGDAWNLTTYELE